MVPPGEIQVDFKNRNGAYPNLPYSHAGPARSFKVDGYDPGLPKPGMLIQKRCPKRWQKVLDHNIAFSTGSDLAPRVRANASKSSFAGTHHSLSLRLWLDEMLSPITGLVEVLSLIHI